MKSWTIFLSKLALTYALAILFAALLIGGCGEDPDASPAHTKTQLQQTNNDRSMGTLVDIRGLTESHAQIVTTIGMWGVEGNPCGAEGTLVTLSVDGKHLWLSDGYVSRAYVIDAAAKG